MNKNETTDTPVYNTLLIIWFALLNSQFLFLIVVYFAKPLLFKFDFNKPFLIDPIPIIVIFIVVALINVAVSFALKKKFTTQAFSDKNPHFFTTALIVGCALCEVASAMGLMLAIAFDYQYFFLWIALGILGTILHFPNKTNFQAAVYESLR